MKCRLPQSSIDFSLFRVSLCYSSSGSFKMAELILLGSGTGVPSLKRGSPGLVVVTEGSRILIDSGPATLRRMLEVGLTYQDMDLLLYTHIPPDHVSDLVPFLFASKYSDLPRKRDLLCVGGPGFRRYFNKIKKVYGSWIASDVDLLVLECSFPNDKKVEGHLTPSLAGRIALESRCKKLLLVHFYPVCDQTDILKECRDVYSGEIILGEVLMRVKI